MPRIALFHLYAADLPFRRPFRHAAAVRAHSDSLILKCTTEDGVVGFGECLPRAYVTGESREQAFGLLSDTILPRLIGRDFSTFEQVPAFLASCNGQAPPGWVAKGVPQTAAWAAVDVALLDTFGRAFEKPAAWEPGDTLPAKFRYSVVLSATPGLGFIERALLARLLGFRQVKLKIDKDGSEELVRTARKILGSRCEIRVDVNMSWTRDAALRLMPRLARYGVRLFEQPLAARDISGMHQLVRETGLDVMADESLNDSESLEQLIAEKACTAVNVRISKCGGLVASLARCRRAREAGLLVQVGCQVGETSLLSAAQLRLIAALGEELRYGEGCFGRHLLRVDPVHPQLTFARAGRPPALPTGAGLGVTLDENELRAYVVRTAAIGPYASRHSPASRG